MDQIDKDLLKKEIKAEMALLKKEIRYHKGMMEKHKESRKTYDEMERAYSMPWDQIAKLQPAEQDRMSDLKSQAVRIGHIQRTTLAKDATKHKHSESALRTKERELENLSKATLD